MAKSTTTHKPPTLAKFQQWAHDCAPAVKAVLMARVFATMERERVDRYILPIFHTYKFTHSDKYGDDPTKLIESPDRLYAVDDLKDPQVLHFYEACDRAHREHGFTGPAGQCPALIAEHLVITTENLLIDLARDLFRLADHQPYGKMRADMLELLIGACVQTGKVTADV